MTDQILLSTGLLTLTILILAAISIWQVAKIFQMSQPRIESSEIAGDKDNRFNGKLMLAFLFFIYIIPLCYIEGVDFCSDFFYNCEYLKHLNLVCF